MLSIGERGTIASTAPDRQSLYRYRVVCSCDSRSALRQPKVLKKSLLWLASPLSSPSASFAAPRTSPTLNTPLPPHPPHTTLAMRINLLVAAFASLPLITAVPTVSNVAIQQCIQDGRAETECQMVSAALIACSTKLTPSISRRAAVRG